MTKSTQPVEFRLGDRVRLRKAHPCGGVNWTVVRLGADIGLVCETCGRRILLARATLEHRMKSFLARGAEHEPAPDPLPPPGDAFPCEVLGLQVDDILEVTADLDVSVAVYYQTTVDTQSGHLSAGDRVRVTRTPTSGSTSAVIEPVNYAEFEQRCVPGGIRQQQSYSGYAIIQLCSELARHFRPIERSGGPERDGKAAR